MIKNLFKIRTVTKAVFFLALLMRMFDAQAQCTAPTGIGTPAVVHASCPGNGQITVSSVSPTAASIAPNYYEYALWDTLGTTEVKPWQPSNVLTNIQPGVYDIRVRKVCVSPAGFSTHITRRVTVNNTEQMPVITNITLQRADVCGNGRFQVSATAGASAPLQYALVDSITAPDPPVSYVRAPQSSNVFDSLTAGTYYVRVYNNCGNAVTQQMVVPAYTATPTFNIYGLAPLGCDSVWFQFSFGDYAYLSSSVDTVNSRLWVTWPDGSTDTIRNFLSRTGVSASSNQIHSLTAHISRIDPLYNPALNYWQNLGNFPYTINVGFRDMCGTVTSSSYTLYEPQTRTLQVVHSTLIDSLTSCDSIATAWRILHNRTAPNQSYSHFFRNMHNFMYSIDTGATWQNGRAANTLTTSSVLSFYSDYFAVPRRNTLLMVAFCGDTLTQVIDSIGIPAMNPTLTQYNRYSCLGNSGINISTQNTLGSLVGIEMLSAPTGQPLVPYFTVPHSGSNSQSYIQLANLMLGTYTIRLWDTIGVECPRFIDRTITLTHPAELDFSTDIACTGNLNVYTSNTYRIANSNQALSTTFKMQVWDSAGTTLLLGGATGYTGNISTIPGFTTATAPAAAVAALPYGQYIIRVFKYHTSYPYLPTDTCTIVEKVWIKQPNILNLIPSKFIPGCPGATGAIIAMAQGGKAPYTYLLTDALSNPVAPTIPGGNIFDNLNAGATYTLQVIDSCGTVVNRTMSVGESPKIFIANATTMPCPNDDVTLFVDSMPGVAYQWYKNGAPMMGETGHELFLPNIQNPADSGAYEVEIEIGSCVVMLSSFLLDPDSCGTPLSVQMGYFTASKQDNKALLEWATYSESNNKGFDIERSTDSRSWAKIGFVNSKAESGNSSAKLSYTFTDKEPVTGNNFYRLKQTDFDGKYEYSPVRMVSFGTGSNISIHPNPAKDNFIISGLEGNESIVLYDVMGRKVRTARAISSTEMIQVTGLSKGVYHLQIIDQSGNATVKKIVVE